MEPFWLDRNLGLAHAETAPAHFENAITVFVGQPASLSSWPAAGHVIALREPANWRTWVEVALNMIRAASQLNRTVLLTGACANLAAAMLIRDYSFTVQRACSQMRFGIPQFQEDMLDVKGLQEFEATIPNRKLVYGETSRPPVAVPPRTPMPAPAPVMPMLGTPPGRPGYQTPVPMMPPIPGVTQGLQPTGNDTLIVPAPPMHAQPPVPPVSGELVVPPEMPANPLSDPAQVASVAEAMVKRALQASDQITATIKAG